MFNLDDIMKYESVETNMTWAQFKATSLYKIYLSHARTRGFEHIKANVDAVMAGKINDHMMRSYGFTRHDAQAPWKLYHYLRSALKKILKNACQQPSKML